MKIKRILIGLIVCTFVTGTIVATSKTSLMGSKTYQPDNKKVEAKMAKSATSEIVELGPDNVAGRTRAVIFDNQDPTNQTLYAGAVAGGLFKTTDGGQHWNRIPMYSNGVEVNLPISCMVQASDGVIYFGTGEGFLKSGGNTFNMAPIGRGLYRFVNENDYSVVPATKPANDSVFDATTDWAYINRLAVAEYNGVTYLYAATNTGLFRWKIQSASDLNNAPAKVFSGAVQDIDVSPRKGLLYFTSVNSIYRIANIVNDAQTYVNVSANYIDSNDVSRIEVAVAPSNENYVYAVVADSVGLTKGVYLTTNQQVWNIITTNTVTIFNRTTNKGWNNSSLSVFPDNPRKIAVGGNSLWIGEGFEGATLYTWTKSTYTESELNAGDYMNTVYVSSSFVHSGIHSVVFPATLNTADDYKTFFMATDGGVFKSNNAGASFEMCNKGLNTVQFLSLAIANDASVLGGAMDNSVPFIESRNASDGGSLNTSAQVLWYGDGGGVASSMFHLLTPLERRAIFVSANGATIGRSYADYSDYTNSQTWTGGVDFNNGLFTSGPDVTPMVLWETTNNTEIADSLVVRIDTTTRITRDDTTFAITYGDDAILAGDVLVAKSRSHFDYPVKYVFPENFSVPREGISVKIHNPIQNRLYVGTGNAGFYKLHMTTAPTDFTKDGASMPWFTLMSFGATSQPHAMAISKDGNSLYVSLDLVDGKGSFLLRIRDLLKGTKSSELEYYPNVTDNNYCVLKIDTVEFNGSKLLPRTITSIATDPRGNDNIIVTCGDFNAELPNMYYITDASETYTVTPKTLVNNQMPLYSSMIEDSTGNVYIGSENGLFVTSDIASANPTWSTRGNFLGVPVFAIKQQTNKMPNIEATYISGINEEYYSWGRTKYPRAIYYATYGRGIFMDMQYVTDTVNEIGIHDVASTASGNSTVKLYPNPAQNYTVVDMDIANASNVAIQMFDISGRVVYAQDLGMAQEGRHAHVIPCQDMKKGIYVLKVIAGTEVMTSKLIVK